MKKAFLLIIMGLAFTTQKAWALPASKCKTVGKNLSVQRGNLKQVSVTYIDCVSEQSKTIHTIVGPNGYFRPLPPINPNAVLPNSKVTVEVHFSHTNQTYPFYGNIGNGLSINCMSMNAGPPSCTCNGSPCSAQ